MPSCFTGSVEEDAALRCARKTISSRFIRLGRPELSLEENLPVRASFFKDKLDEVLFCRPE